MFFVILCTSFQSEIASERPGVLDCLREGGARLVGWSTPQTTRLLPVYKLVLPTLCHGLMHYVISSLAQYTVSVSVKAEIMDSKVQPLSLHSLSSVLQEFLFKHPASTMTKLTSLVNYLV